MDQQIFRLDISMNDIAEVTKSYPLNHLVYEESETFRVDASCIFFEHLQEILLNILKHKVESSFSIQVSVFSYRLKASFKVTMFLYLSMRNIRTSRIIVFFAISSSSDSLNFFIATD